MILTKASTLASFALTGGVVVGAGQAVLTRLGEPALIPPPTWGVSLALLGAIVLGLAWPIRSRVRHPEKGTLVDPMYATRVVLLAKASSLVGSGLAGGAIGLGFFFFTRPVLSPPTLFLVGLAVVGAVVLMVGGLVAERWCSLPPDGPGSSSLGGPEGELL
jgi:drug/metabolite transporter (DMT)-like permease